MAWFLAPYKRDSPRQGMPGVVCRYCAVRDFDAQIRADGGRWQCVEILGDRAVAKVTASVETLAAIAAAPGIVRVPTDRLDDPLSTLTAGQRTAIRNQVLACGYTTDEVNAAFPNLATKTLGEVMQFMASRRQKPRYDQPTDTIVCDGDVQGCESIGGVDGEVA